MIRVAAFQATPKNLAEARVAQVLEALEYADQVHIDFLCFHKGFLTGYYSERELAEQTAIEIDSQFFTDFIPRVCDVSKKEAIEETSRQILAKNIHPSLFFLNAGFAGEAALENPNKFNIKKHEEIMQVNYFGVLNWVEFWEWPCQDNGGTNFVV